MTRTRSEYRLDSLTALPATPVIDAWPVPSDRRDELAHLLLDAYRGTIDDEGEDLDDAREAIDEYLEIIEPQHSVVAVDGDRLVAMSFVLIINQLYYVDPVAVATSHQRRGLGRMAVMRSLHSVAAAGATAIGATITDGNVASERLFGSIGFVRRGPWVSLSRL